MNTSRILKIAVGVLLPMVSACGDDGPSDPATSFTATLSGGNEVPAVTTHRDGHRDPYGERPAD